MRPEFEVNFIHATEEGIAVSGRNCGASIRLGDIFDRVYHGTPTKDDVGDHSEMIHSDERPASLKVTAIEVYGRWSDEISEGMTGLLHLVGTGADGLRTFDYLTIS